MANFTIFTYKHPLVVNLGKVFSPPLVADFSNLKWEHPWWPIMETWPRRTPGG